MEKVILSNTHLNPIYILQHERTYQFTRTFASDYTGIHMRLHVRTCQVP